MVKFSKDLAVFICNIIRLYTFLWKSPNLSTLSSLSLSSVHPIIITWKHIFLSSDENRDFWWLSSQPPHFCIHFETLLFKNEFLFLQTNFWGHSQLLIMWFQYEFDMRRLFTTLQEHHFLWEIFTDVKSAGALATVKSPGFTFQDICYFYRTVTAHKLCSFLGQAACSFTLPGDFAGFVSEQIGPEYKNLRGKAANEQMNFSVMVFKHWWASCKSFSNCCPSLCKAVWPQMFLTLCYSGRKKNQKEVMEKYCSTSILSMIF